MFIQVFNLTFRSIHPTSKAVPSGVIYGLHVTKFKGQSGVVSVVRSTKNQVPLFKVCSSYGLKNGSLCPQPALLLMSNPQDVWLYISLKSVRFSHSYSFPCPKLPFQYSPEECIPLSTNLLSAHWYLSLEISCAPLVHHNQSITSFPNPTPLQYSKDIEPTMLTSCSLFFASPSLHPRSAPTNHSTSF